MWGFGFCGDSVELEKLGFLFQAFVSGQGVTGFECVERPASHSMEGRESEGLPVSMTSTGCFQMQVKMEMRTW